MLFVFFPDLFSLIFVLSICVKIQDTHLKQLHWRNWIAHQTSNLGVVSSSLTWSAFFCLFFVAGGLFRLESPDQKTHFSPLLVCDLNPPIIDQTTSPRYHPRLHPCKVFFSYIRTASERYSSSLKNKKVKMAGSSRLLKELSSSLKTVGRRRSVTDKMC